MEISIQMTQRQFEGIMPAFAQEQQKLAGANAGITVSFTYSSPELWIIDGHLVIGTAFAGKLVGHWGKSSDPKESERAIEALGLALRRELRKGMMPATTQVQTAPET
jgi:hypothetical protein